MYFVFFGPSIARVKKYVEIFIFREKELKISRNKRESELTGFFRLCKPTFKLA